MPNIGFGELVVVLVIALVIFGPGKLPSVGSAIGKTIKEFKKASKEVIDDNSTSNKELDKSDKSI
jgi:sec-independent protein translocase protein TatA